MSDINHYHRCTCGTEWGHALSDPSGPDYAKAHDCPACGCNQRRVSRYENVQERDRFDDHMFRRFMSSTLERM
jgi:hypothetical protein